MSDDRPPDQFHNPYGFVVAADRRAQADPGPYGTLGDEPPVGHHRAHPDRLMGTITIELEARTPLLLPELDGYLPPDQPPGRNQSRKQNRGQSKQKNQTKDDHAVLRTRRDRRDPERPLLPRSGVKGALRNAFEIITNSRFGVFTETEPLAFRPKADASTVDLRPARVVDLDGAGKATHLRLLTGTAGPDRSRDDPQFAAWVHTPRDRGASVVQLGGRNLSARNHHGIEVAAWVVTRQHPPGRGTAAFQYWDTIAIGPVDNPPPAPSEIPDRKRNRPDPDSMRLVTGWLSITGPGARKHDERLFFVDPEAGEAPPCPITDGMRDQWRNVIRSYWSAAKGQGDGRQRHAQQRTGGDRLNIGDLCYVRLSNDDSDPILLPAMIGREVHDASPLYLLPDTLRPASSIFELSPAERVFGWADPEEGARTTHSAYRGQVRVVDTRAVGAEIEGFGRPVPLATLNSPKATYGRWYTYVRTPSGLQPHRGGGVKPLYDKRSTHQGFPDLDGESETGPLSTQLRKVYPVNRRAVSDASYWQVPGSGKGAASIGNGRWQEWPDPEGLKRKTNRSILDWVAPGARFEVEVSFENLSEVELGALLWLLDLNRHLADDEPEALLSVGGGRPLGFGAVRCSITGTEIVHGAGYAESLLSLDPQPVPTGPTVDELVDTYHQALELEYGTTAGEIDFIRQFLVACQGYDDDLPIHYPRLKRPDRSPVAEGHRWFVENERGRAKDIKGQVLGVLTEQTALAYLDEPPEPPRRGHKSAGGGGRRGGGRGDGRRKGN